MIGCVWLRESVCVYLGVGEEEDGLQVLGPCTHEHAFEVLVELVHAVPTLHNTAQGKGNAGSEQAI